MLEYRIIFFLNLTLFESIKNEPWHEKEKTTEKGTTLELFTLVTYITKQWSGTGTGKVNISCSVLWTYKIDSANGADCLGGNTRRTKS